MSASTDGERGGEFYPSANDHVNADGAAPVVLVCEHASNYLPTRYRGLGLPKQELSRHIAWDIGSAEVDSASGDPARRDRDLRSMRQFQKR
jgi:hypothetical protein